MSAQRPLNLDFERPSVSYPDRPWGWTFGWSAFAGGPAASFILDTAVHRGGRHSLRIAAPDSTAGEPHAIMLMAVFVALELAADRLPVAVVGRSDITA